MFDSLYNALGSFLTGSSFDSLLTDFIVMITETNGDLYPMLYILFLIISFGCIIICLTLSFVFKFLLKLVD